MKKITLLIFLLATVSAFAEPITAGSPSPKMANQRVLSQTELQVSPAAESYEVRLPSGLLVHFDSVDVRQNAGVRTILGSSGDAKLLLTTDGTRGYGYLIKGDKHYVIDTVGRNTTITDSSDLKKSGAFSDGWGDDFVVNEELIRKIRERSGLESSAAAAVLSVVDVAFFYDQSVADNEGAQSPRTRAQAAVDYTNAAFVTHGVELELRIVYVGPLSTPLQGDPFSHFISDGERAATASEYGADLMHYIYKKGAESYCGKAFIPGDIGVSATHCNILSETVAHEIGHNLGMHHDRINASDLGLPYSGYNYGTSCGGSGTIMAYIWPHVPHYSSPLLQNGGEDCGVDIGGINPAYNAAVADFTRTSTSNNRTPQASAGSVWIEAAGPFQVSEDNISPIQLTITRDGDLNEASSVEIGAIETSAIEGEDFAEFVERLEFAPGESSKQVVINILDDTRFEPTVEEFDVVLRYPLKLDVINGPVTIQITSDDPDRGIASFNFGGQGVFESHGTLQMVINRSGSTSLSLTVDVELVPTTAVAGVDFTDVSGPVTFDPGVASTTFDLPILDDDLFEGETFVNLAAILVSDNVDYANNTFEVWIWNDDLNTGQGRLSSDVYQVDENAGTMVIVVERINGTEGDYDFCVDFDLDGTAIAGIDYGGGFSACTSISSGQTQQGITTNIIDNDIADGDKYFDVALFPFANDTVSPTRARVIIIDDEVLPGPAGSIQFTASDYPVTEESGTVGVAVARVGGSAGSAAAEYGSSPGTASSDIDYSDVSGTLHWADGDSADKFIQLPIIDDLDLEPAESIQLTLSGFIGANGGSPQIATVTIAESEVPIAPALTYTASEFNARISNPAVIDFEGYVGAGGFLFQGNPGLFSESGVSITNNSQMFLQNNNAYGTDSFLSPQGANPQVVTLTLPAGTRALSFNYQSAAATLTIDGDQQVNLPAVPVATLGYVAIAREVPFSSISIVVNGPGMDIDNVVFSSEFRVSNLPQLVPLPDINADTIEDIAVIRDGSTLAEIRSGANGALQKTITFLSDSFTPISSIALPDSDGNGVAELGVLASRNSDGRIVVEIRNITGAEAPRSVWFATNHTGIDIAVVDDDADANGVVEIAVLSRRNSDGRGLVEVKNAFGATNPVALWAGPGMTSSDVEVLGDKDANGIPEIAILSTRDSDGFIVAEIKNAAGAAMPTAVWFAQGHTAIDMTAVDDKDNNGIPEVAVLSRRNSDGRNVVEVKNAAGPTAPSAVWLAGGYTAMGVKQVHDADNNGVPEVAVLSTRESDGRILVEVKNAFGATNLNSVWYSPGFAARGLAILGDTDTNGAEEALVLMIRDSDGRILVQGRNTAGNAAPKQFWFTP